MKQKLIYLTFAFFVFCELKAQVKICPTFFGQNSWFTKYQDAPFYPSTNATDLSSEWSLISASGVKMIRVGGKGYNYTSNYSNYCAPHSTTTKDITVAGYVSIVDDIR